MGIIIARMMFHSSTWTKTRLGYMMQSKNLYTNRHHHGKIHSSTFKKPSIEHMKHSKTCIQIGIVIAGLLFYSLT